MTTARKAGWRALGIMAFLTIFGCTPTPPPRLLMLNTVPPSGQRTGGPLPRLEVLPVTIAEYLDRAELVRRTSRNEITLYQDDSWAERLSVMLGRVLAADLSNLVPADASDSAPIGTTPIAAQIALDVTEFEIDDSGNAVITGRWTLIDATTRDTLVSEPISFSTPAGSAGGPSDVASLNRVFDQTSGHIAEEVRRQIGIGRLKSL